MATICMFVDSLVYPAAQQAQGILQLNVDMGRHTNINSAAAYIDSLSAGLVVSLCGGLSSTGHSRALVRQGGWYQADQGAPRHCWHHSCHVSF